MLNSWNTPEKVHGTIGRLVLCTRQTHSPFSLSPFCCNQTSRMQKGWKRVQTLVPIWDQSKNNNPTDFNTLYLFMVTDSKESSKSCQAYRMTGLVAAEHSQTRVRKCPALQTFKIPLTHTKDNDHSKKKVQHSFHLQEFHHTHTHPTKKCNFLNSSSKPLVTGERFFLNYSIFFRGGSLI